jgi:hypothetical protein
VWLARYSNRTSDICCVTYTEDSGFARVAAGIGSNLLRRSKNVKLISWSVYYCTGKLQKFQNLDRLLSGVWFYNIMSQISNVNCWPLWACDLGLTRSWLSFTLRAWVRILLVLRYLCWLLIVGFLVLCNNSGVTHILTPRSLFWLLWIQGTRVARGTHQIST